MKYKKSKRFLSLVLSLIMIFSICPTSVYADVGSSLGSALGSAVASGLKLTGIYESIANLVGGSTGIPPSGGTHYNENWGGATINSMWGYKVSVWYAPLDETRSTNTEKVYTWGTGVEFQVGDTVYLRRNDITDQYGKKLYPQFWNEDSIYTQIKSDYFWGRGVKTSNNNTLKIFNTRDNLLLRDSDVANIHAYNVGILKDYLRNLNAIDPNLWTEGDRAMAEFIRRYYSMNDPSIIDLSKIDELTMDYHGDIYGYLYMHVNKEDMVVPYPANMADKESKESVEFVKSWFLMPSNLLSLSMNTYWNYEKYKLNYVWTPQDFIAGRYENKLTGETIEKGQYKIFIEPIMVRNYAGKLGIMTWRDIMEHREAGHSSVVENAADGLPQLVNSFKLQVEDSALKVGESPLNPNSPYIPSKPQLDVYNGSKKLANDPLNGLGVGVLTSPSLNSYTDTPKVVKFFVEIVGANEDGSPIFKPYRPNGIHSEVDYSSYPSFYFPIGMVNPTNILSADNFANISFEGADALLNDVFITDEIMTPSENWAWTNTYLPAGDKKYISFSSEDLVYIKSGLVIQSDQFLKGKFGEVVEGYSEDNIFEYRYSEGYNDYLSDIVGDSDIIEDNNIETLTQYVRFHDGTIIPLTYDTKLDLYVTKSDTGTWRDLMLERTINDTYMRYTAGDGKGLTLGIMDGRTVSILSEEDAARLGVKTPANTLVLRYVINPVATQFNVIDVIQENYDGTETLLRRETSSNELELEVTDVEVIEEAYSPAGTDDVFMREIENILKQKATIQQPISEIAEKYGVTIEMKSYVTNERTSPYNISNGVLPPVGYNGKSGNYNGSFEIQDYPFEDPIKHNLYVKWEVRVPGPPNTDIDSPLEEYEVPEWRLSKYFKPIEEVGQGIASMSLPIEYGCHDIQSLSPSGLWNYTVLNPAEDGSKKFKSYLHSETKKYDNSTISINKTSAAVFLSGYINAIKSTETSNINAANWIEGQSGSINGLKDFDVMSNIKGNVFDKNRYYKDAILCFKVKNLDTYYNYYAVGYESEEGGHEHYSALNTISPSEASYTDAIVGLRVFFDRYNQTDTSSRIKSFESKVSKANNYTTLKYQPGDTLTVYPEYGMLFDNDNNEESIKWAVSDKSRTIKPVVYQTLRHKVYVNPVSSGMTATDTRATKLANTFGTDKTKPMLYKGGSVQTAFGVQRDESGKKGMLTVKTFALDIKTNSNGVNVKNDWGNGSYNSQSYHNNLIDSLGSLKATAEERLIVGDTKGAILSEKTGEYKKVTYNGNTVTTFTHELVVRGGQVIGVRLADRNTGVTSSTAISMSELKTKDDALYEALLNMNLYNEDNNKANTVLDTFEHKAGKNLNEGIYATMLNEARKSIDKIDTPYSSSVLEGSGWYSEDSTVLLVKEYVTNYDVPSISFNDKLSLNYPGLDAPMDKNQLFSKGDRGYTYLKYYFPVSVGGVSSDVYFEYDSKDGVNGKQGANYLVPNVSVTDMTRVN